MARNHGGKSLDNLSASQQITRLLEAGRAHLGSQVEEVLEELNNAKLMPVPTTPEKLVAADAPVPEE